MVLDIRARADDAAMTPIACMLVEDQTIFLQLLSGMLRAMPGIEVVASAGTVADAKAIIAERGDDRSIDLLILDLGLPDGDGRDVLEAAAARYPDLDCIVLSAAASEFNAPEPLLDHVRAVVDKTQAYEQLQAEISEIRRLRGHADTGLDVAAIATLRPRELAVFRLIGQGLTSAAISESLGISRHTVETHRKNIVNRLRVSGAELVRLATLHNHTALP
jgi:two-component system nitrate/nitrite response regulator NarL